MMSGILKRKLEEGTVPYLSLQGSDDEVSCGDSGNSSDSVNQSASSGLLDSSLVQQSKRLRGRNVHFESVTVYYFNRRQGFTSVPTQGGSTLGMSPHHSGVKSFTLREFALEQKQSHRNMLRDHLKEEKLNAIKLKLTKNGTVSSVEADSLTLEDISEDDLDVDNTEVDDYFFLQPLATRRRRSLLRASGVRRIDVDEKHELRALRMSREECGCRCRGICDPETCACSLAGIKCQVDRMSFPCGCTKDGCSNNSGRLEFNPVRVRTHFLHTIMKLELEKSRDEQYQHQQPEQQQQLVTNGNGYHDDSTLVQQQQQQQPNLQFPLMSSTQHIPVMHLQSDLEEEEEEEEEDEENDDDEAYDEDGSSVCSGLSDCSTHSLDTIDTQEEEDDEDDEEDDDDNDDDDEWDPPVNGPSPPHYSVPLPSMLSYTSMNLGAPFQGAAPVAPYQMDRLDSGAPAFLTDKVSIPATLPTVESVLEAQLKPGLPRPFPNALSSAHMDSIEASAAPAAKNTDDPHSQTQSFANNQILVEEESTTQKYFVKTCDLKPTPENLDPPAL